MRPPKRIRIIPSLLLKGEALVKGQGFAKHQYLGDPINIAKLFNDKMADELIVLDIEGNQAKFKRNLSLLQELASECFMPICYGGGIRSLNEIETVLALGIEKVSINTHALENPAFVEQAAKEFGSSTLLVSIDYKRNFWGKNHVYSHAGSKECKQKPLDWAKEMESRGAGELLLCNVEREGSRKGYDISGLKEISDAVTIPVIASGGASSEEDMLKVIREAKVDAVSAGTFFVLHGKLNAVLVSFVDTERFHKNLFAL